MLHRGGPNSRAYLPIGSWLKSTFPQVLPKYAESSIHILMLLIMAGRDGTKHFVWWGSNDILRGHGRTEQTGPGNTQEHKGPIR